MTKVLKLTTALMAASLTFGTVPATAGGFGDFLKGVERDAKNGLRTFDKKVLQPAHKAQKKIVNGAGKTAEKIIKAAPSLIVLKTLDDTLIKGKSLKKSSKESLGRLKDGARAAAKVPTVLHPLQHAHTEVISNVFGKEAGRVAGYIKVPQQVVDHLPGLATESIIKSSEDKDNVEQIVGIPLGAALEQAKAYYAGKGNPIPDEVKTLLAVTFDDVHLENVRYVVDATGGNLAGLINGIKEQMGETHNGNHAVAIDNIIVFAKEPRGVEDLFFWAHEVQHTVQYKNMGILGFAAEYTKNYKALEESADAVANKAVAAVQGIINAVQKLNKNS